MSRYATTQGKTGDGSVSHCWDTEPSPVLQIVIEREITVDKTKYHIKSVFIGQTTLGNALRNIVLRKLDEEHWSA
jgi:hypothetical protein